MLRRPDTVLARSGMDKLSGEEVITDPQFLVQDQESFWSQGTKEGEVESQT